MSGAGQVLLVGVSASSLDDEIAALREQLEAELPGVRVLVIAGATTLLALDPVPVGSVESLPKATINIVDDPAARRRESLDMLRRTVPWSHK